MDAGLQSGDIEIFSNVLSVVIPKFWTNTVIDKLVSVQPATSPYPIVYYVDWVYGDDHTADSLFGQSLQDPTHMDGYGTPTDNQMLVGQRSLSYGNVPELTAGRKIKAVVRNESLTTTIKRINAEWTLESIIALASVMGLQNAANFVDQRITNVIYTKLRDEVEWTVINDMWASVIGAHTSDFTLTPGGIADTPTELAKYREGVTETIENLAAKVFRIYGVKPNWMLIGTPAYNLLQREKMQLVADPANFIGSVGRFYMGTYDRAWNVVYDPYMPGILMGCNYPENEISSAVFAPYLIGNTQPITEKTANTYRIVYRVDAHKILLANTLCKINFV